MPRIFKIDSIIKRWVCFLAALCIMVSVYGCGGEIENLRYNDSASAKLAEERAGGKEREEAAQEKAADLLKDIPEYSGDPYVDVNGGLPDFSDSDKQTTEAFEYYSELDSLGRCGAAYANICPELMPTEERGDISQVKPSGWHSVQYDDLIEDGSLYNRCHLIGYQLAGENANEKNLITGTRYMNVEGMLPFEDMVDGYVDSAGNHVLYRVTPIFEGTNLVASGVEMEGWSVEDGGAGICFHVYCYNVQPGIEINYADGESREAPEETAQPDIASGAGEDASSGSDTSEDLPGELDIRDYVLNTNTKKIHLPDCVGVSDMAEHNKEEYTGTISELKAQGYAPCENCLSEYK